MRRYKLTTNLGLKIMAFVFSVFLWLIVVNIDNPVSDVTFNDIPVTIVNDDIITSSGEVYQVVGEQTVSVVVSVNRKVRQSLSAEDIIATADIKEMDTSTGLVPVKISIPNYSYESAEAVPKNLQIQREKSGKKVLALTVRTDGSERDGYKVGKMTVNPENITITGAQSTLDQIDQAVALVNINGISEDEVRSADLYLYDADGNIINQNQLENNLGEDGVTVSIEVLKIKTVPVTAEASGTPAEGYRYSGCKVEPERIQICGKSDVLSDINEIEVSPSAVNINGAQSDVEETVNITSYLPEGVSLVDENSGNVKITAAIEQEGTRTIDFLVSSIIINDLSDDLTVSYKPDAEVVFTFSGEQSRLDSLDISNAVSVDMKGYTQPGTYDVPVTIALPDGITLTSKVTVQLTLEKKQVNDEENPIDSGESSGDGETEDSSGQ